MPLTDRLALRESLLQSPDPFVTAIPKVELHLHIEGIITPELKWKFSQRNGQVLKHPRTGAVFSSLEELRDSHDVMKLRQLKRERMDNAEETLSFFEAYYGGFEVLKTKEDYFDLAMCYFERAAAMKVRYCELFFDPQGHTKVGTKWETMMEGFREAQKVAERDLNVSGRTGVQMYWARADKVRHSSSRPGSCVSSVTNRQSQPWSITSPRSTTAT